MLEARGLTKCYASLPAVSDVSFSIRPGEVLSRRPRVWSALCCSGARCTCGCCPRHSSGAWKLFAKLLEDELEATELIFEDAPAPAVELLKLTGT